MNVVTAVIVVLMVLAAVHGYRVGLGRIVLPTAGYVAGFLLGVRVVAPLVMRSIDAPVGKMVSAALATLALSLIGGAIGSVAARRFDRASDRLHLGVATRALGATLQAAMVLFLAWLLASGLATVEAYGIGRQVQASPIIRALNSALPTPPDLVSRLKGFISPNGFPNVFLAGEPQPTQVSPGGPVDAAVLATAEKSVVQLVGPGCGGEVEGSGVVVAPGVVVTNAHVVAGVRRPTVVDAAGRHDAKVVLFNPDEDLAVLIASTLKAPPLATDPDTLAPGTRGTVVGYPGGGPLRADDAVVVDSMTAVGQNIYGQGSVSRAIYQLAANVQPGNSGGPLVTADGRVAGIVFAKSVKQDAVGYALVWNELAAQVDAARTLTAAVPTGACSVE
ncbi:MAG: MarP family serine protease [Cellulomonas sp.]|nr:MarP family serine protease [Cellulomonas sp.]